MDRDAVLQAYDEQVRGSTVPPQPGWRVELASQDRVLRVVSPPEHEWGCFVIWSDLDESDADEVIAEQVDFFRALGRTFEWKWFGYDRPDDLRSRLTAAGLLAEADESLVVGEVDEVVESCTSALVAEGVTLRHVRNDDLDKDFAGIVALNEKVWGEDLSWLMAELREELEHSPDDLRIHVAEAGDQIVCAAWVRFHHGTDFASLWGGATLPEWRRKGIYRALVGRRAVQARDRGFRYLQVDASDDSKPILQRLGMSMLTGTTPFHWKP
ncbi:MAG: GNAT family N-acetyltransferase [Actinomycetes bacterium]